MFVVNDIERANTARNESSAFGDVVRQISRSALLIAQMSSPLRIERQARLWI
jgi:hypothetical protein